MCYIELKYEPMCGLAIQLETLLWTRTFGFSTIFKSWTDLNNAWDSLGIIQDLRMVEKLKCFVQNKDSSSCAIKLIKLFQIYLLSWKTGLSRLTFWIAQNIQETFDNQLMHTIFIIVKFIQKKERFSWSILPRL